ncbi:YceI-like domain-containing protein [Polaribacter sp. Hel1_33_78]|jgi:polyisoprenoid-binding protein YceI|uniref:YceI family protein n=1 Tax=Polaribacter sp. Hel1_33_78 TaxID=1336804 RepID=UPI00087C2528|nr:YceI family protein [Polaribacter sp. Hel1_33_78]SDT99966.1 YceI-like domain-containing protein [Polaribacter sp. Hel1_33_78]
MKLLYTILCCSFFVAVTNSQDRYLTKNGAINFYSKAPMEDITADNNQVLSIIDASKGKMAIQILMKSFLFEKALMQEHFNENYVESDTYPKATFKGTILNFDTINATASKQQVKGMLTIHGVTKEITIDANFTKTDALILVDGNFIIEVDDFNIQIPAVVAKNIAKKIKVSFDFNHKPYKK